MQLHKDAEVIKANGDKVGTVERVVLDPKTQEVTHYVVSKGFLLTTEKVIPVEKFKSSPGGNAILEEGVKDFDEFPDFEDTHYVVAKNNEEIDPELDTPGMYFYPPLGEWWTAGGYIFYDKPDFVKKTEINIPENTVALQEGAEVLSKDNKHIGDVERVMTDPVEDRATHLVISEGVFLKDQKVIPTNWVAMVREDKVYLSVDADTFENVPKFKEEY